MKTDSTKKTFWCTDNGGYPLDDDETRRLISCVPTNRQLEYSRLHYYSFIHFTVNTFTGREWGDGTESENIFFPKNLDTDQWCRVLSETGSKGVILTAKHHDGFCLFDTKYTDHNSMNSPIHADIVALLAKSCKKYNMKLGIYLSPWDRHEKTYGTPAYNDFFVGQLTELCTNYGDIFEFWFDGACGDSVDGGIAFYDWERYWRTIRTLQPNAIIANCGPDVRWIGNEAGKTRESEFNVLSWDGDEIDRVREKSQRDELEIGHLQSFDRMDEDIGSREKLLGKNNLVWYPAEADVSVDNGWFYHDDEYYHEKNIPPTRTPEQLADIFVKTIGSNSSLLLNVPPDPDGLINEREIKVLRETKKILDEKFSKRTDYFCIAADTDDNAVGLCEFPYKFDDNIGSLIIVPKNPVRRIYIREDTRFSQRIEQFTVNGEKYTTIGTGKIIEFDRATDKIELSINVSRGTPIIEKIVLFE